MGKIYDLLVIGWGKAGKTLSAKLGAKGKKIAIKMCIRDSINYPNANIYFLVGGTQTNTTVISHSLKPYEAVIACKTGHISIHETGAIEATGHKIIEVDGIDGKLTPNLILNELRKHEDHHMVKPKMVYISNTTEIGTVYTKNELESISKVCKENNLYLYLDGARLASALASEKCDINLEDYPKYCDVFYIGGTKCGLLFGEAVVIINDEIIGASICHYESHEMINLLALAINQKIKSKVLKDFVYTHPIFTESLNDILE